MRLFSSQVWVMPSLVPSRPLRLRSKVLMPLISWASELDLDVDAGRQVETHQRVDGLRRGVDDVDETLVGAHLEVLAAVLVLVRRADDAVDVLLGRQGHRAGDLRARTGDRVNDLARRGVDHLVVIGLEPDADLLSRHSSQFVLTTRTAKSDVTRRATPIASLRPTPAVGRVAPCSTQHDTAWIVLEWHPTKPWERFVEPGRASRCGADTEPDHRSRRPCSVVNVCTTCVTRPGDPAGATGLSCQRPPGLIKSRPTPRAASATREAPELRGCPPARLLGEPHRDQRTTTTCLGAARPPGRRLPARHRARSGGCLPATCRRPRSTDRRCTSRGSWRCGRSRSGTSSTARSRRSAATPPPWSGSRPS